MLKLSLIVSLLVLVEMSVGSIKEHELHTEKHMDEDGEHNVEYDHEAVLGGMDEEDLEDDDLFEDTDHDGYIGSKDLNKQFSELSPEEAKKRLNVLIEKMDKEKDGIITKQELSDWVTKSFKHLDEEDARDRFKEHDLNDDKKVTWAEYVKHTYDIDNLDIKDLKEDKNPAVKQYADTLEEDALKFNLADTNKDGALEVKEFYAFQHPWNYDHMHMIEIHQAFKEHDTNKDKVIDLAEYLGKEERSEETRIVDTENFNNYDKDKNGKLDENEVKDWVIPDYKGAADDEAAHLIEHSDTDGDGKLTREEILDKYDLWVGSSATDYGRTLHEEL